VVAGLIAAGSAACFVEVLRAHRLLDFSFDGGTVARAWSIPHHVVLDFVLVFWILLRDLAHGRRVRGAWLATAFPHPPGGRGRFARAFATALENGSANGIVVDVDGETAVLHSLDTRVVTGRKVL
jgi:hypothetical protein